MPKSHKGKNNNLQKHREVMMERNRALIAKAIDHITTLGGKITMSAVAKVTHDIADPDKGEKGMTLAGISKNTLYRTMVEEAANRSSAVVEEKKGKRGDMTEGDVRLMLHALRVEKIKLEEENRILRRQLLDLPPQIEMVDSFSESMYQEHKTLREMFRSLIFRLSEMDIVYFDQESALRLAVYNDEVVPAKVITNLFDEKEIQHGS